jgi:hypothetical protein
MSWLTKWARGAVRLYYQTSLRPRMQGAALATGLSAGRVEDLLAILDAEFEKLIKSL